MKVNIVEDKKTWEDFVQSFSPNNFLTSWEWGEFNKKMDKDVLRLGLWEDSNLLGVCLTIVERAKRGDFLLCPAGPLLKDFNLKNFKIVVSELKSIAAKVKAKFVRIRPLYIVGRVEKTIKQEGFIESPTYVHAQVSWILDITKDEEQLLSEMRKSTRYLVKHTAKDGLRVEEKSSLSGVQILEKLQKETVQRHQFTPFSNEYLEKEFETFNKNKQIKVLVSFQNEQPLAAAMVIFYGDSAFYHQGASAKTKLPATYMLQWEMIKKAKVFGKKYYNFWGITPNNSSRHPWSGLTYFKQGFGGFRLDYTKPHDLPLSPFYPFIYWFEKLRQKTRGL